MESNRMTLIYFVVSSLDVMNELHRIQPKFQSIIDTVYSLQVLPDKENPGIYIYINSQFLFINFLFFLIFFYIFLCEKREKFSKLWI